MHFHLFMLTEECLMAWGEIWRVLPRSVSALPLLLVTERFCNNVFSSIHKTQGLHVKGKGDRQTRVYKMLTLY